jgi:ribokinase
MRILNIGSINVDEVFGVEHFVRPSETISSLSYARHAGGKGSNQSIALGRAGASVFHAGRVGEDGGFSLEALRGSDVDVSLVISGATPTGRAIIQVREDGQNCILLLGGANAEISHADVDRFLAGWGEGDALLLQNETSSTDYILAEAARRGLTIFFNPSPIKDNIATLPLGEVDYLLFNEVEGAALAGESDSDAMLRGLRSRWPGTNLVLTLGEEGVRYSGVDGSSLSLPARKVKAVDTTAAGDTFTGYFIAALLRGEGAELALSDAVLASAICVTREGAASSIPWRREL